MDAAVLRPHRKDGWRSTGDAVAHGGAGVVLQVGASIVAVGDRRSNLGHGFAAQACPARGEELGWQARSARGDLEHGVGRVRLRGGELLVGVPEACGGRLAACHHRAPGWLWRF